MASKLKKGKQVAGESESANKPRTKQQVFLNRLAIVLIMMVLAYSMAVSSGMIE